MANDSKIVLTAGLQIPQTVNTITNDLKQVADQLNSKQALRITSNIDLSATTTRIQSQLATISQNLKIEIPNINLNANTGNVANATSGAVSSAKQAQTSITGISNTISSEIDKMKENLAQRFGVDARSIITKFTKDSNEALKGFELEVQKTSGAIEKFKYSIDAQTGFIKELGTSGTDRGIVQTLANATKEADKLSIKLTGLKATYTDVNASKPIKQDENIQQLAVAYSKAEMAIAALRNTDAQSYQQLSSNAQAEIDNYNNLAKALRNAETIASKLRAKPFDVVKQDSLNNLDAFIKKMERMSLTTGVSSLTQEAQTLKTALGAVSNPSELVQVEGEISNLKSEFGRLSETAQKGNAFIDLQNKVQLAITSLTQFALQYKNTIETFNGQSNGFTFAQSFQYFMEELESSDMNKARLEQLTQQIRNFESEVKLVDQQLAQNNQATKNKEKFDIIKQDTLDKLDLFVQKMQQLNTKSGLPVLTQEAEQVRNALSTATTQEGLDTAIRQFDALKVSVANLNGEARNSNAMQALQNNIAKTQSSLDKFAAANSKAVNSLKQMKDGRTFFQAFADLNNALKGDNLSADKLRQINQEFQTFKNETSAAGLTSTNFFKSMGQQLEMVVARWFSLYTVIGKVREAINNVIALDDAMTKLKRVTDETNQSYSKFLDAAYTTAKETSTTVTDVVEQAAKWAKAGESFGDLQQLSKTSLIYSVVGDIDNDTAVNDMVTALRGFNMTASESIDIVDKLDNLNNRYAVDAKGLGEGLTKSASAMYAANNTLDETLALLTGGGEITQNLAEMGAALRTTAMRIRGQKGELEKLGEEYENVNSLSKIQTQLLNRTGVNIYDPQNNFKSTYQILKEISDVWGELTQSTQADVSEILFGKMRSNQGLAIINSFREGRIQAALEDSKNSAGTATAEMARFAESVTASINTFKNAWQNLSKDFLKSDFLKGVVDTGTKLVEILDKIVSMGGSLSTVAGTIGVIAGTKGTSFRNLLSQKATISTDDVAALRQYNTLLGQGMSVADASAQALANSSNAARQLAASANGAAVAETTLATAENRVTLATKAATVAKTAFNAVMSVGINLLVVAGITAITKAFDVLITTEEEAKQQFEETVNVFNANAEKLNEEAKTLDTLKAEYLEIITSTGNLSDEKERLSSIQDEITSKYKDEADGIDLVNGKLSDNIKLLEEQEKKNASDFVKNNQGAYETALNKLNKINDVVQNYGRDNTGFIKGSAYGFNATGVTRFTDAEYRAFESLNLPNYIDIKNKGFRDDFFLTGTIEQQLESLKQIRDTYAEIEGHSAKRLKQLDDEVATMENEVNAAKQVVNEYEKQEKIANGKSVSENLSAQYDGIYNKVAETQQKIKNLETQDGNEFALRTAQDDLAKYKQELDEISTMSPEFKTRTQDLYSAMAKGANEAAEANKSYLQTFEEIRDGSFKEVIDDVAAIESAIKSLSEGNSLSRTDAWKIIDMDTEGIINDIRIINGEYVIGGENQKQLIALKDKFIEKEKEELLIEARKQKQIADNIEHEMKLAQMRLNNIVARGINSSGDEARYKDASQKVKMYESQLNDINRTLEREKYLYAELNSHIDDTVNLTADVVANTEKAYEAQIKAYEKQLKEIEKQGNILEDEQEALEAEKEELQKQLDVLKEQEDELKQIIEDYKSVASLIDDYISKEEQQLKDQLDALKEQRDAEKDVFNEKIDALKSQKEALQEQNEEIDLQLQKEKALQELENARNQKVRTYDSARGWTWESNADDIAEKQAALDKIVTEERLAEYDKQIKALEEERDRNDKELEKQEKEFDKQIKAYEDYAKQWADITKDIENADNELLTEQIFGSNWREKIKDKDVSLLQTYKSQYSDYNRQMKTLTETEISEMNKRIKAKDEEIEAKKEQIKAWNKYKDSISDALNAAKDAYSDYKDAIAEANANIISSLDEQNAEARKKYDEACNDFDSYILRRWNLNERLRNDAEYQNRLMNESLDASIDEYLEKLNRLSSQDVADIGAVTLGWMTSGFPRFASGGVNTTTGFAYMDGTNQRPELVLNNTDAAKLYNMIHSMPMVQSYSPTPLANMSTKNVTNAPSLSIGNVTVVANNPTEFANNLDKAIDTYFHNKLLSSYTN